MKRVDVRRKSISGSGNSSVKALRYDCIWYVESTARKPLWLELSEYWEDRR